MFKWMLNNYWKNRYMYKQGKTKHLVHLEVGLNNNNIIRGLKK